MGVPPHCFAIVHSPGPQGGPVMLHAALHADAASVAFASELQRLQRAGGAGDLLVYCLHTNRVVLRQSLACCDEADDQRFVAPGPVPGDLSGALFSV